MSKQNTQKILVKVELGDSGIFQFIELPAAEHMGLKTELISPRKLKKWTKITEAFESMQDEMYNIYYNEK